MNPHAAQLDAALRELDIWLKDLPAGDQTSSKTYEHIRDMIAEAKLRQEEEPLYEYISGINRIICDQGPLTEKFLPTFKSLFLGLHELRSKKRANQAVEPTAPSGRGSP